MNKNSAKPTPEAKALSLFLMAHKSVNPTFKNESRRMNSLWDKVSINKITKDQYQEEVQKALTNYGGYDAVVEKTVKFYIDKTGEWKLQGDDKYCVDAKAVADKLLTK
jgi:hypothetical protein